MQKLFTNNKFFLIVTLIAVIGTCFGGYVQTLYYEYNIFLVIIYVVPEIVIYLSYRTHNKNLMKGMIGALLMALIVNSYYWLEAIELPIDRKCAPIHFVLVLLFVINHFIISGDHYSRPINIFINQFLIILITINTIVWQIAWIPYGVNTLAKINFAFSILYIPSSYALIACVESFLDFYRVKREEAGWSEEKGYPEGYKRNK